MDTAHVKCQNCELEDSNHDSTGSLDGRKGADREGLGGGTRQLSRGYVAGGAKVQKKPIRDLNPRG
jgi:hypothetical protein